MTRPGERLRNFVQHFSSTLLLDRIIDPTIADMQREYADALSHGRRWRGYGVQVAGYWAILKGVSLHTASRSSFYRMTGAAAALVGLTVALLRIPLQRLAQNPSHLPAVWVIYLLPQALAIAVPVWFTAGVMAALLGTDMTPRRRSWTVAIALLCSIGTFINVGWITPAANQQFRVLIAGRLIAPGAPELSITALRRQIDRPASVRELAPSPLPLTLSYQARLAIAAAPLMLGCYALFAIALPRSRVVRVHALLTLSAFAGCFALFPPEEIAMLLRWLPPIAIAWLPNAMVAAATATIIPMRRGGCERVSHRPSPAAGG